MPNAGGSSAIGSLTFVGALKEKADADASTDRRAIACVFMVYGLCDCSIVQWDNGGKVAIVVMFSPTQRNDLAVLSIQLQSAVSANKPVRSDRHQRVA